MNTEKGMLIVISAPAGCGKDSIIGGLLESSYGVGLSYSISVTTREPRANEKEGEHYFFKNREKFEKMIRNGELLEYTEYCGNYYGTLKETVMSALEEGRNIVLKIEGEGAENVRRLFPAALLIFIMPPSLGELRRRIETRDTEDFETIERRLRKAQKEIANSNNYDYIVTNDDLQTAINEVADIIRKESTKREIKS